MNDLLDDLQAERVAPKPALPRPPDDSTPSVALRWTPLQWTRPRLAVPARGGLSLRVGPLTVELTRTDP
ncbi:MAG: hypothetical protein Q8R60_07040 [Mycobacteriales bacterium]|nr:hypothetical protein [Mycobacteriales bacterium]